MKLLIFTDLHLDNWGAFSTITSGGYNSRFMEQAKVFESLLVYAEEHNCNLVFGGDLFNRRLLVPTDVLHITYELLKSYDKQTIYLLVGNHDMYTWVTTSTVLSVFSGLKHVNVIDEPCTVYVQPNVSLSLIPHGALIPASSAALRKQDHYQILVTHYGVNEARLGPKDFRMKDDLTVKQLKELDYDLVLIGHIHKPQALADNIIVMGSVMAHSFHEAGEEKYFYIFDCEDRTLVKYQTNAPQFLVHDVKTKKQLKSIDVGDGNYHRINILSGKILPSDTAPFTGSNVIISHAARSSYGDEAEVVEQLQVRTPEDEVEDYYQVLDTELSKKKLVRRSLDIIGGE